jgi:hypothetical protein
VWFWIVLVNGDILLQDYPNALNFEMSLVLFCLVFTLHDFFWFLHFTSYHTLMECGVIFQFRVILIFFICNVVYRVA